VLYFELTLQHQYRYISIILISIAFIMLSTLNLPVRPSPQKRPRKHWLSDSELSQSQSQSSSSPSLSHESGSDPFGGWSDSEADETLEDIPSLGHVFPDSQGLVDFAKDWAESVGYALVIARTTKNNKDEVTRVYLRCDRGGRPKAGQENTRLVDCKFQLAGHLREGGWMLSCDKSKG
jgi:hypothetical protein